MTVIFSAVVPLALIILIGFVAGRILSSESGSLSEITIYILSPALIADSLYRTTLSAGSISGLLIGLAITTSFLYFACWLVSKIFKLSSLKKSLIATILFPNNGNMGLPFLSFALGSAGLERAIIYMIGTSILMYCLGPALLKGQGIGFGLRLTLKLPFFWAILAGLGLRFSPVQLPFNLDTTIQNLGQAAIPLALIVLGMELAYTRFKLGTTEFLAAAMRLILAPLIAYFVGRSMSLESLDLQVLVLQSAMPTAVSTTVLVNEFGGDTSWVARTIVVSTLMSFLTLPVVFFLVR